jgi:hypothetical protein
MQSENAKLKEALQVRVAKSADMEKDVAKLHDDLEVAQMVIQRLRAKSQVCCDFRVFLPEFGAFCVFRGDFADFFRLFCLRRHRSQLRRFQVGDELQALQQTVAEQSEAMRILTEEKRQLLEERAIGVRHGEENTAAQTVEFRAEIERLRAQIASAENSADAAADTVVAERDQLRDALGNNCAFSVRIPI